MALTQDMAPPVPTWRHPWSLVIYGLGAGVTAVILSQIDVPALDGIRVVLTGASLILVGLAVIRRLRNGVTDLEDRTEPTCLVGLAATVAFLASISLGPWDSGVMLAKVLGAVGLMGACLVALPVVPRKFLASLIILFHFGGILTAVTSVPPPGAASPWLAAQAWAYVYHPYLQFMYLNNAYHFYSPEPGPPTLLWFRVTYKSHNSQTVVVPSRANSPIPMHYMRLVAMSETYNEMDTPTLDEFNLLRQRRETAANFGRGIPVHPEMPLQNQYQRPNEYSLILLSSYVRHIAETTPRAADPSDPVVSVKVYRVTHRVLSPDEYARGVSPLEKSNYYPYYFGEYDAEGNLLTSRANPLLYWLIPIFKDPSQPGGVRDCVEEQNRDK